MYAGRVVERAPTRTLFHDTQMPYTQALMDSIPRLADASGTRLRAIAGRPPDLIHPPSGCRFAPRCPYVQDKCRESEPPLRTAGSPDHLFACWFPLVNGVSTAPPVAVRCRRRSRPGRRSGAPARVDRAGVPGAPGASDATGMRRHRPGGSDAGDAPPDPTTGRAMTDVATDSGSGAAGDDVVLDVRRPGRGVPERPPDRACRLRGELHRPRR